MPLIDKIDSHHGGIEIFVIGQFSKCADAKLVESIEIREFVTSLLEVEHGNATHSYRRNHTKNTQMSE